MGSVVASKVASEEEEANSSDSEEVVGTWAFREVAIVP